MSIREVNSVEALVWTEQDLCSGCGRCGEIAPSIFRLAGTGVTVVHQDGVESQTDGVNGRVVSGEELENSKDAAAACPGEIIFIEERL